MFSPHPLCPTVLIRMTKRKTATIDSHTPLWAVLAHFNSVLMHHVSIKPLIMWQRQPQGQIASNRLGVIFIHARARWRLRLNVCGLLDVCISCSFWSLYSLCGATQHLCQILAQFQFLPENHYFSVHHFWDSNQVQPPPLFFFFFFGRMMGL